MIWNEQTLFKHWRGNQGFINDHTQWSSIIRQGHSSQLMLDIDADDRTDDDSFDDYCQRVDAILWQHWDPLCVNKLTACRNEYHEFAWDIARASLYGNQEQLVAELYALESFYFNIENPDTLERAIFVADQLLKTCRVTSE